MVFIRVFIDEQALCCAADAGAAHLGVEDDGGCDIEIGTAIDIGVANAFKVREDGHAGFVLHALDQAFAAARHDHVDSAV